MKWVVWKLVHADVFRPPDKLPMLFCVCVGTGVPRRLCAPRSPSSSRRPASSHQRIGGSLATAVLVLFVMMGIFAGYASATLYKIFKGRLWQKCTYARRSRFRAFASALFPHLRLVAVLLRLDGGRARRFISIIVGTVVRGLRTSRLCRSLPRVQARAAGLPDDHQQHPAGSAHAPALVFLSVWFTTTVGGILPFGACFVELFFILSSMWMDQYYYVFGFTGLVFIILVATCCEITIVLCYFQLCSNHRWWWRSFLTPGSTAFYVFAYSVDYFRRLGADEWFTYVLYFGYMGLICVGLFLLTGTCGFLACLWFTKD